MDYWKSVSFLMGVSVILGAMGWYLAVRAGVASGADCLLPGAVDLPLALVGMALAIGACWASYNAGRADEKTRPR